ncbi:hypothetical protein [Rugosimonospora africana]|uniref:hypothetical protein n=1 Tax=Rugosimonospora africana TaxID=556532 RepID=UPI001942D783|nr:hypothetical protein [Rugosimonospora africana]
MTDEIEHRLAGAARALREYQMVTAWVAELGRRQEASAAELGSLSEASDAEQRDVKRLEGVSFTRILVSLRGARDDALARERAEADAAGYRVTQAQARLAVLRQEYDAARARLARLSGAPQDYAAALDFKEAHLRGSTDPRGARLLRLAEERGWLGAELREVGEALTAAQAAWQALSHVWDLLGSASGWSTYDTFFGGGALSSAVKHSRLDDAARAAAHADACLAVLRAELSDVGEAAPIAPGVAVTGPTRFVDVWFDNIFTDLAVRQRIRQAQRNVAGSMRLVWQLTERLTWRQAQARQRLTAIDVERHALLTRPA